MSIKIRNQKPAILYQDPFDVLPNINADKSVADYQDKLTDHIKERYIKPMYAPINANHPVVIEDNTNGNKQQIDEDTLFNGVMHLWTNPTIDVNLQNQIGEIYRQGIQYHAQNDWYFEEQLGVEAITRMKLPVPSQKAGRIVKYSASVDVIPTAKAFLAQPDAAGAINWFANIAAYTHDRPFNNYLLMTVQTADVFNDIKQQLKNYVQAWQAQQPITKEVNKLLADFDKIDLTSDLSAGLFMPNGGGGNPSEQDTLSFTRIIMYIMSQYEKNTTNPGALTIQPSNLQQVYMPENIIILNLENYAHAKATDIKKDWDVFEKALNAKKNLRFVSNKKLMTAKAINRSIGGGQKATSADGKGKSLERAKVQPFSGKPIPAQQMLAMMKRVIESQVTKQVTQNTYKSQSTSYMRPNRRKPDDINLPGKLTTTMYRPDIHVYLDTSGSISESQYRDAVTNLIMLTKRINCNLYITSFSHYVSQTSLLKTKDRSTSQIYQQFLRVPKVTGGTDFEQVWRKIDLIDEFNKKNNYSHQINFMITDFGYSLSSGHRWSREQASLKNTYYVPMSMDPYGWNHLRRWAKEFREQMIKAGDYGVRKRMLL
ncbi:hypothetical protein JUJ52_03145 [Virgibacillus sp. AGTR]|uniref:hypothetical protein n=1 Tax=Virgibacillus sp. AGTR TaxID=2812055 RepID=UPI001D16D123|nr:hypothetical protein [Virgibacillus sp. AGTR]MCC2248954.1 hypothetical protein [Virgibacillus sp. AGTR]